jgi:hypothetical protein
MPRCLHRLLAAIVIVSLLRPAFAQPQPPLVGIGVAVESRDDGTIVMPTILPDGPAAKAGIATGDELLAVEGRSVADMRLPQIVELIRGQAGTEVNITIRTPGQRPRTLKLTRAAVNLPPNAGAPPANPLDRGGAAPPAPNPAQNPLTRGNQAPANPLARGNDAPANPIAPNQPAQVAGAGTVKFTRLSIKDPGINNIEAVSLLVPVGWKSEGGVLWFPEYSILANLQLKLTDPASGAMIQTLPVQNFTWINQPVVPMQPGQNYMGNIVSQPITDIRQFIQTYYIPQVLTHLQSGRAIGGEDLPKVAQQISQSYGGQSQVRASRVRYEYNNQGQPWEEDVYVALVYTPWQMGTLWSVNQGYSFRAPKGKLDAMTPLMLSVVNSTRISPDWFGGYMYVQQLFNNRMNQGIKDAAAISQTVTQNSEEIRRMFSESYKQRQESQDRIAQSYSETIRGVDTYKTPDATSVQLPSGYRDAWVNNRGEYILSNEAGFDPNVGDTSSWQRLQRRGEAP